MATFREKHDPIRLFWRRLGMVALLVLVVAAASSVWNVYHKERESRVLRMQSELQLTELTKQQNQLDAQITKLGTERGKEESLRQQYAVGKPGEGLIIIVDPEQKQDVKAATTTSTGWFHALFNW